MTQWEHEVNKSCLVPRPATNIDNKKLYCHAHICHHQHFSKQKTLMLFPAGKSKLENRCIETCTEAVQQTTRQYCQEAREGEIISRINPFEAGKLTLAFDADMAPLRQNTVVRLDPSSSQGIHHIVRRWHHVTWQLG